MTEFEKLKQESKDKFLHYQNREKEIELQRIKNLSDPMSLLTQIVTSLTYKKMIDKDFEPSIEDVFDSIFPPKLQQKEIKWSCPETIDQLQIQINDQIRNNLIEAFNDEYKFSSDDKSLKELYIKCSNSWRGRDYFTKYFSWSIPNIEALIEICEIGEIIEIFSGTGYWASLISQLGGKIKCYDDFSWYSYNEYKHFAKHYPVDHINNLDFDLIRNCNLMIAWPPMGDNECKRYLELIQPNKLIYIGELEGGCCGSDDFFEHLDRYYKEIKKVNLPQWSGIHDILVIYERKSS